MRVLPIAAMLLTTGSASSFAQIAASLDSPQCYEEVGCPHKDRISGAQARGLSCENLWLVRNTIFHQRGYCFQSGRGQKEFSNSRCSVNAVADLKLAGVEAANVATLERVERGKGCVR